MSAHYRVTRVRRDAMPVEFDLKLMFARVGSRVRLTVYGVEWDAVITELSLAWVEFTSEDES